MALDVMDLSGAADRLGVHYQTAYKWIRTGDLPATTVGGRYQVRVADIDTLAKRRATPSPPRVRRPRHGFGPVSARCHQLLVEGDERGLRKQVADLMADGVGITAVLQELIGPGLRRIGEDWHNGELAIAVEHRATAMVERLIGEQNPNPRGRRRGTAVVAAPAGDRHGLPTSMAAAALRDNNWHVHHLGADLPAAELVRFCDENDVDLVVLSVTTSEGGIVADEIESLFEPRPERLLRGQPGATLYQLQFDAREAA